MTEDQLEQEALGWLASVGYTPLNARDLDPGGQSKSPTYGRFKIPHLSSSASICACLGR